MTVAFMLAYGLFEVPWGRLGDRFGARDLLVLVVLGGSLMTAGVAAVVLLPRVYSVQLGCLLLLRFLFGMFQAGTFPVLSRLIADWIPDDRARRGPGLPLDVQPGRRRAGPDRHGLALPPPGELAVAAGPRREPGGALVPGRLALAPQPAGADAPGQRRRSAP